MRWPVGPWRARLRVGWQPSRFLTDRAEAERAFQLAERLGSVNAAAQELGTTWPPLHKAFTRHGLGMPAPNPQAVRQRAIDAIRQRTERPATPSLDPVFVALNPNALPARPRSPAELYQWVRREEQYATLGANVVVELNSESRARRPTARAWAIRPYTVRRPHHGRYRSRPAVLASRSRRASAYCPASPVHEWSRAQVRDHPFRSLPVADAFGPLLVHSCALGGAIEVGCRRAGRDEGIWRIQAQPHEGRPSGSGLLPLPANDRLECRGWAG
jgi:hypothetical protein